MKTKTITTVNARGFRQYAVMLKKNLFSKWHFVTNARGEIKVYGKSELEDALKNLQQSL